MLIYNKMIELEQYINSVQLSDLQNEVTRKSQSSVRRLKSHEQLLGSVQYRKQQSLKRNYPYSNQRLGSFGDFLKIKRDYERQTLQEKFFLLNRDRYRKQSKRQFKVTVNTPLESDIFITPKRQQNLFKRLSEQFQIKRHLKSLEQQENSFKQKKVQGGFKLIQIKRSIQKKQFKPTAPRLSIVKQILKIQEQKKKQSRNDLQKQCITLQPIKKSKENISDSFDQLSLMKKKQQNYFNIPKRKERRRQAKSLKLKKFELSAWTFHNIEQQMNQ